eukprot:IDg4438t1
MALKKEAQLTTSSSSEISSSVIMSQSNSCLLPPFAPRAPSHGRAECARVFAAHAVDLSKPTRPSSPPFAITSAIAHQLVFACASSPFGNANRRHCNMSRIDLGQHGPEYRSRPVKYNATAVVVDGTVVLNNGG